MKAQDAEALEFVAGGKTASMMVAMVKKNKPDAIEVQVDRVGFVVPDEFVVGYGLDYAGRYRNLPYIGVLDPSVYTPSDDKANESSR